MTAQVKLKMIRKAGNRSVIIDKQRGSYEAIGEAATIHQVRRAAD